MRLTVRKHGFRPCALLLLLLCCRLGAQAPESTASLLLRLDSERDYAARERLLLRVTSQDAEAGPALLKLAQTTTHNDTRWLLMRSMACLHYTECAPFLEVWLRDADPLIRANAARALGDLKIMDALPAVLAMFVAERNPDAIQQASAVLAYTFSAKAAAPSLREKIPLYTGQTRAWLISALGEVGNIGDVPLLATFLDERVSEEMAAGAISRLTGIDFGAPRPMGLSGSDPPQLIGARAWWQSHKDAWPRCDDCHPSALPKQ